MKIASVAIVATTAIALSAPIAGAQSVADLQAMINSLLAQIQQIQTQISAQGGTTGGVMTSCSFTRDLTVGSTGDDVKCLQQWLNGKGFTVSTSGAGAPGSESTYFGAKTQSALAKFQAANGITPSVGYFGPKTRASVASMGGVGTGTGTGTGTVTGGSVTVTLAPSQPAASLAPISAARVPFTRVTFTAGAADAVITGVVVERTGLANDAVFSGIVLLDENGNQLGIEKTFNSDHKLTLTEPFTVRAGTSRTMTIAGNMGTATTYNGQVASLSVVGVNTAGSVGGTFPITGASHTINSTLTIGSFVSPQVGSNPADPQANNTKEVGTTGYVFSSVRFSAGSAEDVRVWKIRWNQSGSAAQGDLANLMVWVKGSQSFPVTVSADGKYYTADLGGILLAKGDSIDIAIKGDIVGGSGRTIDFDIDRRTDVFVTGNTFGYGITPANGTDTSGTDDSAFHLNTNPWFDASQATVSNGSISVSKATTITSQNVAENVANSPVGGFDVEVRGEPISISSIVFNVSVASQQSGGNQSDLTNVTLVGPGGIVAGPVDGISTGVGTGAITFTDTVTFPIGKGTYALKGKVGTDFVNDQTITASTTPSSDWTTVRGQVTGNTITPSPSSAVTGNTMTVKSSALTVSILGDPVIQTIVAGVQDFVFAKYSLDATASGEDVRVTSIALQLTAATDNSQDSLTNCALWDGATQLNTGSNLVNPADTTTNAVEHTFTLDNNVIMTKGASKTLSLTCDVAPGTTADYAWGLAAAAAVNSTGVTSGQSISETINSGAGQAMTATAGGSLTVALDTASPAYRIAAANTTDNTIAVLKLHATNEAINVAQLGLELNGTASNSPSDMTKVTIWNGATKVGEVIFVTDFATATLSGVTVPKDGDTFLTVKGDFAAIGTSLAGTQGALIKVDYDSDAADTAGDATRGTGNSSGSAIYATGSDTASNGVRVFKGYPLVARLSLGDTSALGGSTTREIARWSVKANNNDVSVFKFTFRIATSSTPSGTSSTTVTNLKVFAFTDSGLSSPVSNYSAGGQLNATAAQLVGVGTTDIDVTFGHASGPAGSTSDYVTIPANTTYYFKATTDVALTGGPTSASISTTLQGDTAYAELASLMHQADIVDADNGGNDDFIWSPNATTTSLTSHKDWTNGYQAAGLPADNLDAWGLTK